MAKQWGSVPFLLLHLIELKVGIDVIELCYFEMEEEIHLYNLGETVEVARDGLRG